MKTMRLAHGDLVIGRSSDYQMIVNTVKVEQDVRNALLEPLGNDRFHPGWGSVLHDHIGLPADEFRRAAVLGEVNRVVSNYAAVQRDRVEADILGGADTRFTTDEIIAGVSNVDVRANLDTFAVGITINTAAGSTVTIEERLA